MTNGLPLVVHWIPALFQPAILLAVVIWPRTLACPFDVVCFVSGSVSSRPLPTGQPFSNFAISWAILLGLRPRPGMSPVNSDGEMNFFCVVILLFLSVVVVVQETGLVFSDRPDGLRSVCYFTAMLRGGIA